MTALEDVSLEKLHAAGQVRTFSALLTVKVGSKYLNKSNACSITFTTGSVAERPMLGDWAMTALFAEGLTGLSRQLAFDMASIRANCMAVGAVDKDLWAGMPPKRQEAFTKSHAGKWADWAVWKGGGCGRGIFAPDEGWECNRYCDT
jgi:NAD(P)-dependent dehydrogenase (short-subunit alcohol dehydrogenase family)